MKKNLPPKKPLSIYIHFPYCDVKCPFCNLNAWEKKSFDETPYIQSLKKEFETRTGQMPEISSRYAVETVFMGGGTPSLFSPRAMGEILKTVGRKCEITKSAEISLEAHPLSCKIPELKGWRSAGINRISIGAQSFSENKLKALGRMHGAKQSFESVENAKSAGFQNISIDIISAAPGETPEQFEDDIKTAAGTDANHVSVYGLEIEKGTRFHRLAKSGKLSIPSEDISAQMMEIASDELQKRGLARYEISSFAAHKNRCRHNINYWRCGDYIGLGAGAHSHMTTKNAPLGLRWANPRNPDEYMKNSARNIVPKCAGLDPETGFSDSVMMGMRLAEGMDIGLAEKKFGVKADGDALAKLENGGFISRKNGVVKLTGKGLPVANSVIAEIVSRAKVLP